VKREMGHSAHMRGEPTLVGKKGNPRSPTRKQRLFTVFREEAKKEIRVFNFEQRKGPPRMIRSMDFRKQRGHSRGEKPEDEESV